MPAPVTPPDPTAPAAGRKPRDDEVDLFGVTHEGRVRPENQDHFLVATLHKTMRVRATSLPNPEILELPSERLASVLMVADGVGGSKAGAEASRAALETVAAYVTHAMRCYFAQDEEQESGFIPVLQMVADLTHAEVLARASRRPELRGMATTLTLAVVLWPKLYLLHVGDSRCYVLREGHLLQLTRDQTMAQYLIDRGALDPAQARGSRFANVLASAIGGTTQPEVGAYDLTLGDVLLLCTDGLTKHVPDDRIRDRLAGMESSRGVSRALVQDALDAGGSDNVTVVVGRAVLRD